MARKIFKKLNKSQKSLLLGLLIGDGTITNHPDFKMDHSGGQEEYLQWKTNLLDIEGLKHSEMKEYIQKIGYNVGSKVIRVRLKTNPTIKALRRSIYKPNKIITRNWLNWFPNVNLLSGIWMTDVLM